MPLLLKETEVLPQIAGLESVLIVPCRFCPAASLAVREGKPYLEPLGHLLRTESFESFIQSLSRRLRDRGIRTAVFDSKLLHQFVACMWTRKRRSEFARRAQEFDGVLVLGCDGMIAAVRDALESTDCRIIRGMEVEGMMNLIPTASFPCNLSLELRSVTPVMKETSVRE